MGAPGERPACSGPICTRTTPLSSTRPRHLRARTGSVRTVLTEAQRRWVPRFRRDRQERLCPRRSLRGALAAPRRRARRWKIAQRSLRTSDSLSVTSLSARSGRNYGLLWLAPQSGLKEARLINVIWETCHKC